MGLLQHSLQMHREMTKTMETDSIENHNLANTSQNAHLITTGEGLQVFDFNKDLITHGAKRVHSTPKRVILTDQQKTDYSPHETALTS